MPFLDAADILAATGILRGPVRQIIDEVSELSGISAEDIISDSRQREHVRARDIVCYVASRHGMSRSQIGRVIGRDESSVGTAIEREARRRAEGFDEKSTLRPCGID